MIVLDEFITSIHLKKKIRLTFYSNEDMEEITRICVPLDYGPIKNSKDNFNRYQFYDLNSDKGKHPLLLLPDKIRNIEYLNEFFNPEEIVNWTITPKWHIKRDWGTKS